MTVTKFSRERLEAARTLWMGHWPEALAVWSRFTKLRDPVFCFTEEDEAREFASGSIAMIRFSDNSVVIGLRQVATHNLDQLGFEILAHEIGHHVYCPADLGDQGRIIARMRKALRYREDLAGMVANLYEDLLINNRLQRQHGLRIADVYKSLAGGSKDDLWTVYMRIYEILWSLPRLTLTSVETKDTMEVDAQLGARMIQIFAKDWLKGAGRFAAICYPYLFKNDGAEIQKILRPVFDAKNPMNQGDPDSVPDGLIEADSDEEDGSKHPSLDKELSGFEDFGEDDAGEGDGKKAPKKTSDVPAGGGSGQYREPFEYGEILKALGINFKPDEIAIRYYRERAAPHLISFPTRKMPESQEPLIEGLDHWDVGSPLEELDLFESAMISPRIIPGATTVQRNYGTSPGSLPEKQPIDLDLYVDCSGSMPNPQKSTSFLTLAGTIITLSALRVGSRVKATLWSGKSDYKTTGAFLRDEKEIMKILTGYIGGWTAFPIHLLRDTFQDRTEKDRPVHVLIISDDGVDTLFQKDEKGNAGSEISKMALQKGRGGGTMVLNLYREVHQTPMLVEAQTHGWKVFRVRSWDDLVAFAREFSKAHYGKRNE